MARFRLSTDVLSPLHSDISLNDISAFSFGNLSGTPDSDTPDKNILSPLYENPEKHFDTNLLCSSAKKEGADKFEMVANKIKKQINQNKSMKKEERFSESYKMLKKSMDDLFNAQSLNSEGRSHTSKNLDLENSDQLKKTDTNKVFEDTQTLKIHSDPLFSSTESKSLISSRRTENKKENFSSKTERTSKVKKNNLSQESGDIKNKDCTKSKSEIKNVSAGCGELTTKRSSRSKTSSTQTNKSAKTETNGSKNPSEKNEGKEASNVRAFTFKSQRKIPVSDNISTVEQKAISLEKSIQIAIGMEMDSVRGFLLDQNWSMQKEIFKLQEMAKKQAEDTSKLFSVIDGLLEENKKLISKCNSQNT